MKKYQSSDTAMETLEGLVGVNPKIEMIKMIFLINKIFVIKIKMLIKTIILINKNDDPNFIKFYLKNVDQKNVWSTSIFDKKKVDQKNVDKKKQLNQNIIIKFFKFNFNKFKWSK